MTVANLKVGDRIDLGNLYENGENVQGEIIDDNFLGIGRLIKLDNGQGNLAVIDKEKDE